MRVMECYFLHLKSRIDILNFLNLVYVINTIINSFHSRVLYVLILKTLRDCKYKMT
jgi:hypothetical protein